MARKPLRTPGKPLGTLNLYLMALLMGVVAGLGAVIFRGMIAILHNLLFLGKFSFIYDANVHTVASPWGPFVILVPVVGALGVAFLVLNFAPEAKGHGVPEVMDAIYYNRGIIRPVVAAVKSLASALCIGSGGAIGREGPIIQIGSSFGSTMGQLLGLPVWQVITLVAAGAGGGIAATFNTPIGGVLFAVEIMMAEISVRTLVPVAISTAMATYVGRIFFGPHPSFIIPAFESVYFHLTSPLVLFAYVGLGVLLGLVSTVYIRSIYIFEDFFEEKVSHNYYVRHVLGMVLVGVIIYILMRTTGHYYIEGVGYATVQDVLTGANHTLYLLLLLFALKLLATSLTLGSGASGGIFSPALFLGATFGGAYGVIISMIFPHIGISPPAFAVAGMAGVVGGATGAALTSIVMIFEMTLNYNVIVPMTITVALSYGIRMLLCEQSIYTLKLTRRGHHIPEMLHANPHYLTRAGGAMQDCTDKIVAAGQTVEEFSRTIVNGAEYSWWVVAEHGKVVGMVSKEMILEALLHPERGTTLGQIARGDYLAVTENVQLYNVLMNMCCRPAPVALVMAEAGATEVAAVKGIISKERVVDSMTGAVELCSLWSD